MISAIGYKNGIVVGLLVTAIGCLLFIPAANWNLCVFFLGALFILASDITILQVSANPFVNALGSESSAPSRLNLSQGFNSLVTTVAPFVGGALILVGSATAVTEVGTVKLPYLIIAVLLVAAACVFYKIKLPKINEDKGDSISTLAESTRLL